MRRIKPLYFRNYPEYKSYLIRTMKAKNFKASSITTSIDGTSVTITSFIFYVNDKKMYGKIEPETGFAEVDSKPIGKIS